MLATQHVLAPMARAGGGAVVNVASIAGLGLAPYQSPEYGAAKAGLIRFTSTLDVLDERMGSASTASCRTGSSPSARGPRSPR
jgi:NAD(P)-dependent dehydrogenase (short-subunit alcohol dehydrogenase family)